MDSAGAGEADNQRDVELSSLSAIFPEMLIDENDPYHFTLELPVNPSKTVTVSFSPAGDGAVLAPKTPHTETRTDQLNSHKLSYLPSVRLEVSLPPGYPEAQAPEVTVSASPPWIPDETVKRLQNDST